jgi:hypothetical protein
MLGKSQINLKHKNIISCYLNQVSLEIFNCIYMCVCVYTNAGANILYYCHNFMALILEHIC